jgi:hypothetical protein
MPKVSYAPKARGERALMASLFQPEQDEKRGAAWGTEWGRKRSLDQGGVRLRGPVNAKHAIDARANRLKAPGFSGTDRNFGPGDRHAGRGHIDGRLVKPAYRPEQTSYRTPSPGAGRSGGLPMWASGSRVKANSGYDYFGGWDAKGVPLAAVEGK